MEVQAGDLGFSVLIFCIMACSCVCLILIRRNYGGGELGGNVAFKRLCCGILICMWVMYVVLSALQSSGTIKSSI